MNEGLRGNVQKYNNLNGCIIRRFGENLRRELQLGLRKITSKRALMYGSETWVLRAKDRGHLEAAQRRFLRSVFGVTLRDKIKSEAIRTQLREDNIVAEIRCYQEKWRQRVMRTPTNRFTRCAFTFKPLGKRDL
jgi:hypothetical protein